VLSRYTSPGNLDAMDVPSHLAAAAAGVIAGASLGEATDPLVRTIGGWASFGGAAMCAWEATRDEPRWDRAAGLGAAVGTVIGSLVLLHDIVTTW
jgi:hypothetical protein